MAEQDTAAAGRAADQLVSGLPGGTPDSAPPVGAGPSAPLAPTSTGKATLGDLFHARLGAALQDGISTPEGQAAVNSPGGFMKMILASAADALAPSKPAPGPSNAQRFVEGFDKLISPLSNLKGSAFEGAGSVAKADLEQREKDRREAEARNQRMTQDQREKLQLGLNIAQANMNMIHSQYLLHKDMEEERDKNITDGKQALQDLTTQAQPGVVVQKDITSDQLKEMIDKHTADIKNGVRADQARGFDPTQMTAFATGKVQIGTDSNGVPQYRNTYTLVRLPEKYSFTSKEQFMTLGKYLFKDASNSELTELASHIDKDHPLVVAGGDYNNAFQARETSNAITAAAQKASDEAAIGQRERADKVEAMNFRGNEIWTQDLRQAMDAHKDWSYPEQVVDAFRKLQANPPKDAQGNKIYPNLDEDVANAFGEKNMNNLFLQAEKARHDREAERIANIRAQAAQKKEATDKQVAHDYDTQLKRLDADRKLVEPKLAEFANLESAMNQNDAAGDALIAPMLLKALVAGGGVRITQAEINQVTHGRSTAGDVQAWATRKVNGKSISDEQRRQLRAFAQILRSKVDAKSQLLIEAEPALAAAETVAEQQKVMSDLHRSMAALDGESVAEQTPGQANAQAGQKSIINPPTKTPVQAALPKAPTAGAVMPKDVAQRYINAYQNKDAARKAAADNGWKLGQ